MSTEGFPAGPDATYEVSSDWDGTEEDIDTATWTEIDGIGDAGTVDGSPNIEGYRSPTIHELGPVTTIITLNGWHRPADAGQAILIAARADRSTIGFRWRPDGTEDTGECYQVKVGGRNHSASAEGGLQPVTFPLIAQSHVVLEPES